MEAAEESTRLPQGQEDSQRLFRRFLIVFALGMGLYLALGIWSGWAPLAEAVGRLSPGRLAAVMGLVSLGLLLRAGRWQLFVRRQGWGVPAWPSLKIFLAGFAFTATPGKAGEVVKSSFLKRDYGVPIPESLGVLVAERLYDLLAVLLLAAGGAGMLAGVGFYLGACAVLIAAIGAFAYFRSIHGPVLGLAARVPKLGPAADKALAMLAAARRLLRPRTFLVALGISLASWACEAVAFHLLLEGMNVDLHLLAATLIYGLATVVGALSMLPGGIGGMEAVMIVLLERQGAPQPVAVAATILLRACTLWFASLIGFVFLGLVSKRATVSAEPRREASDAV